jgi:HSP20 family protein
MAHTAKQAKEPAQDKSLTRRERSEYLSPLNPFSLLDSFRSEMDRLFDDFGFGRSFSIPRFGRFRSGFDWSPQTEVFEQNDQLVVRADLPGLTKDDITVDIQDDQITIRGERKSEHKEKNEGSFRSERSYGTFYRSIPLPQGVDAGKAKANFNSGVLEITVPVPARKPAGRRLEIKEAPAPASKASAAGR